MDEILSVVSVPPKASIPLGEQGERLAARHLIKNGYHIVAANFKVPVGRNGKGVQVTGEIDIIALDGTTLCFIEVKTRRSDEFTPIITNVNLRKQRQIIRTARVYRRIFGVRDIEVRYDVVTVLLPRHARPHIELEKDFWTEGKFRKRRWEQAFWHEIY